MSKIPPPPGIQTPLAQLIGIAVAAGLSLISRKEGRAIVGCSLLVLGVAVLAANRR
jgi:hypothetical protein